MTWFWGAMTTCRRFSCSVTIVTKRDANQRSENELGMVTLTIRKAKAGEFLNAGVSDQLL